ncbi:MAG: hypothetical protein IPM29_19650 [Planctomycetes bacterium]|nr:hypothetical protein [Planctomycetota bacterium]
MGGALRVVGPAVILRGSLLGIVVSSLAGCLSPSTRLDLVETDDLYAPTGYEARLPADRGAFVAPLVDRRDQAPADARTGPYPITWMPEGYWDRPVDVMIDDLLRRELEDSKVVARLDAEPPPEPGDLLIRPTLTRARVGTEDLVNGQRRIAEVSIHLLVLGPVGPGGERGTLLDEDVVETTGTGIAFSPPRLPVVLGGAVRGCLARLLKRIDESNVARSGVPLDLESR